MNMIVFCSDHFGFTANTRFCFKCYIVRHPLLTVLCTFLLVIAMLTFTLRIFERPYHNSLTVENGDHKVGDRSFDRLFNSLWCVVITLTTVGYGDFRPGTTYGKFIIMIASIWGTFLISLIIISLQQVLDMSTPQKKAFHNLLLTRKAAKTITSSMSYYLQKKKLRRQIEQPASINS